MAINGPIKCLFIEHVAGEVRLIFHLVKNLQDAEINLIHVTGLKEIEEAINQGVDVILLELNLPECQGVETLNKVKSIIPELPIVVLTNEHDSKLAIDVIRRGAQDCLLKENLSGLHLVRSLYFAIERHQSHHEQATSSTNKPSYLSAYDVLTGLPNQNSFYDFLQQTISEGKQQQQLFAMIFICINETDKVYKTFGHQAGDQLLKTLAVKLSQFLTKSQFLSRYGQNEFAILLKELTYRKDVAEFADALQKVISEPIILMKQEYVTASNMGIVIYPFDGEEADELIDKARNAMMIARGRGLNQFVFMSDQIDRLKEEKLIWESEIQFALKNNEFYLHYQPQFDINGDKLLGAEVLLRWKHRKYGMVSPDKFIGIAEEAGLIIPIGNWVLHTAAKQIHSWHSRGIKNTPFTIAINVSAYQLQHSDLLSIVQKTIDQYKLPPKLIEIELTERALMTNTELVIKKLRQLQNIGISVAIDDFGTGYSSLSYLGHLPINKVKLDRSFVQKNMEDPATRTVVRSIISLIHDLGLRVVAEGVETQAELDLLRQQGCNAVQGYLFSHPIPAEEFSRMIDLQY